MKFNKQRELIIGVDASFVEKMIMKYGKPGDKLITVTDNEWIKEMEENVVIMMRALLEEHNEVRQLLPYLILRRWSTRLGKYEYFLYVRLEGVGEKSLVGNLSGGYGGHVDIVDFRADPDRNKISEIDIFETLMANLRREGPEEISFYIETLTDENISKPNRDILITELAQRWIVGTEGADIRHLGLVVLGELPPDYGIICSELTQAAEAPQPSQAILDSGRQLESWTKIFLENLIQSDLQDAGKPATIATIPLNNRYLIDQAVVRRFTDIEAVEHAITLVKDKGYREAVKFLFPYISDENYNAENYDILFGAIDRIGRAASSARYESSTVEIIEMLYPEEIAHALNNASNDVLISEEFPALLSIYNLGPLDEVSGLTVEGFRNRLFFRLTSDWAPLIRLLKNARRIADPA